MPGWCWIWRHRFRRRWRNCSGGCISTIPRCGFSQRASDAAEAAVRAGHTSAAVYSVYLALGRIFTVDYPEILILPDFFREEDNIYAESRVTLRPVALLAFRSRICDPAA
ncbi:MAG: DUF2953 domain-containing protein [Acutalibacteraceae bacterium]